MKRPYRYRILILLIASITSVISCVALLALGIFAIVQLHVWGMVVSVVQAIFAAALYIVFMHVREFFQWQARQELQEGGWCVHCLYPVGGNPDATACPECGHPWDRRA